MSYRNIARVEDSLLAKCAEEPIHIPGMVQGHAALLCFERSSQNILYASGNLADYLNVRGDAAIELNLADLYGNSSELNRDLTSLDKILGVESRMRLPLSMSGPFADLEVEGHRVDENKIVLELERKVEANRSTSESVALELNRMQAITDLALSSPDLKALADEICNGIRETTGFDRVMAYQMDEDGHGEVIAEAKREGIESYLSLHFPASDIPAQARSLYLKNRVRVVSDTNAQAIPVLARKGVACDRPLDMSLCHSRRVSPVHVEYLSYMGVRATLVLSIVIDNRLWGLVACHHYSPKHINATTRQTCHRMAQLLSLSIRAGEQHESRMAAESSQLACAGLAQQVGLGEDWHQRLKEAQDSLLKIPNADSFMLVSETECIRVGRMPSVATVNQLTNHLKDVPVLQLFSSDSLVNSGNAFRQIDQDGCGCLAIRLSHQPMTFVAWFRREFARTVNWCGDPRKSTVEDEGGVRLSPRKSFQKWQQDVKGCSRPWSVSEQHSARAVASFISARMVEDSERQKSHFLATISHEIRTPMTAIQGYAGQLAELVDDAEGRAAIEVIQRNGEVLLGIIDGLLEFSKLDQGDLQLQPVSIPVKPFAQDVFRQFESTAREKALRFELDLSCTLPHEFRSDPIQLRRALVNLIDNAIKFTKSGFVRLKVKEINCPEDRQLLQFQVEDTGAGLAPSQLAKLLKPFVRVEESMSRRLGGTGLGLAMSHLIAESLGGTLQVCSEPAKGSTFALTIAPIEEPLQVDDHCQSGSDQPATVDLGSSRTESDSVNAEADEDEIVSESEFEALFETQIEINTLTGKRVLVVEDGPDNQRLFGFILKREGAEVVLADHGQAGIDLLVEYQSQGESIDVILMDMQMPIMDGYEATARIRELGYTGPVIAVTAHALAHDRKRCLDVGCDEYTTKPINRGHLLGLIREILQRRRANQIHDLTPNRR